MRYCYYWEVCWYVLSFNILYTLTRIFNSVISQCWCLFQNHRFSDYFRENRNSLICLNSLNITSEIWRWSLKDFAVCSRVWFDWESFVWKLIKISRVVSLCSIDVVAQIAYFCTAWKVSVFLVFLILIQSECGKMRTRKTPNTETFYTVLRLLEGRITHGCFENQENLEKFKEVCY